MSFQPTRFLDTSLFTATLLTRHRDKIENGILRLRDFTDDDDVVIDTAIVKDWKNAKSLMSRMRSLGGISLGRVWVEVLPPFSGTPWTSETGDYADQYTRTRTCLVPSPGAFSYCGGAQASLVVGLVTACDMRLLCSEVNFGEHARIHLVADVKALPVDADA